MLESLTVYSKGGLILYQYSASPSLLGASNGDGPSFTRQSINSIQARVRNNITNSNSNNSNNNNDAFINNPESACGYHISNGITFVWKTETNSAIVVCAMYPDILFEGPRQYLRNWADALVTMTYTSYQQYYNNSTSMDDTDDPTKLLRPDPMGFDVAFRQLLQDSKTQKQTSTITTEAVPSETTTGSDNKKTEQPNASSSVKKSSTTKKEQRHWSGQGKMTEQAMSELDKSSVEGKVNKTGTELIQEAKLQYLPTQEEQDELLKQQQSNAPSASSTSPWSTKMTNLWQQLSLNQPLTQTDLQAPLQQMEQLLLEKNVASSIAKLLCQQVQKELIGQKLKSFYRIQAAVQQALERAILNVLEHEPKHDLLRQVLAKKESQSSSGGWLSSNTQKRRPYVICVLGINGIGKTTTLAKLAYYFQTNNCRPLLVAADTFRSGAVEQLKTHAKCLECDIFHQGYSKDPSAVALAAIQYATTQQQAYDVILVDTAGRMQNNVPLMNALTKLVTTVQMDSILFVCEALVGHDALSQFQMFQRAVRNKIDGIVLTKYDTVGTKVGAALTLTHETSTPIVFVGTGQKYHHLQRLNPNSVIESLFA